MTTPTYEVTDRTGDVLWTCTWHVEAIQIYTEHPDAVAILRDGHPVMTFAGATSLAAAAMTSKGI